MRLAKQQVKNISHQAIFAPVSDDTVLLAKVKELRLNHSVIQGLSEKDTPELLGCNQALVFESNSWQVKPVL